jgi:hypothetical protein
MPALSVSLSEATPGGRDSGAPCWSDANVIKSGKHGVPGVAPSPMRGTWYLGWGYCTSWVAHGAMGGTWYQ